MKVTIFFIFSVLLSLVMANGSLAAIESRKIDTFGPLECDDEMARLDNFAIEVQKAPDARGYIVIYGGRRDTRRDEVQVRGARMKRYLVENRGVGSKRIQMMNGGYRETFTIELWLVPSDEPTPAATPTIKEGAVRFKRGRMDRYREPGCFPGKYAVPKARPA